MSKIGMQFQWPITTTFVEKYAAMTIGSRLLLSAIETAKDAWKTGNTKLAEEWMTVAAGVAVLMEKDDTPIELPISRKAVIDTLKSQQPKRDEP